MTHVNYSANVDEMGPAEIKEANRLMWCVKGQLIPEAYSDVDVNRVLHGYFKRLWGNHERASYCNEAFEIAWENKQNQ